MLCVCVKVGEALADCRKQLTRVVAVLQEVAAAGSQMIAPLAETEGLTPLKIEDMMFKVVDQVHTHTHTHRERERHTHTHTHRETHTQGDTLTHVHACFFVFFLSGDIP